MNSFHRSHISCFIAFLFLLVVSWFYFSVIAFTHSYSAILLILWAFLLIFQMHIVMDRPSGFFSKAHSQGAPKTKLSEAILMAQNASHSNSIYNILLRLFHVRFAIWGCLVVIFLALCLYAALYVSSTPSFQNWALLTQDFLQDDDHKLFLSAPFFVQQSLQHFSHILIICIASILARSFTIHKSYADILFVLSIVLFSMSVMLNIGLSGFLFIFSYAFIDAPNLFGMGWGFLNTPFYMDYIDRIVVIYDQHSSVPAYIHRMIQMGWAGYLWLYGLGLYAGFIFLRVSSKTRGKQSYAFGGIVVLCVMFLSDLFIIEHPRIMGLWLSGWVLISIFWMCIEGRDQKRVRLYQL